MCLLRYSLTEVMELGRYFITSSVVRPCHVETFTGGMILIHVDGMVLPHST